MSSQHESRAYLHEAVEGQVPDYVQEYIPELPSANEKTDVDQFLFWHITLSLSCHMLLLPG